MQLAHCSKVELAVCCGSQGIKEYEPRVVHQLLDFMYRNVAEVLQVAEVSTSSLQQHMPNCESV